MGADLKKYKLRLNHILNDAATSKTRGQQKNIYDAEYKYGKCVAFAFGYFRESDDFTAKETFLILDYLHRKRHIWSSHNLIIYKGDKIVSKEQLLWDLI